ncbi:hypothetical protein G5C66_00900 [Nocardioides sp. KC13]|uniref:Uncharacterized protein n=1 Tax=Nocardioides turkmenicus TaxID=2711220 RepID=A0A6M1QU10_9ACTN|nr:hypothetical protein [Nocardioides sp. KC13]NGN91296.1 hypothetical protein [Nocardioides sp. KC13]
MTSNTSAASAGGSAGASGVGFQNQVFAWAASWLVAEEPLPISLIAGKVVQVGAQTGFEVDDVAVLTDLGSGMFVQAKVGMALGTTDDSPLAKALRQAVELYLEGTVPEVGTGGRPVDASRDAIVLCTDYSAPATVRNDLRQALRRVASQPPGTVLGKELTGPQNAALKVALGHIQPAWSAARASVEPTDEELRTLFRALHVLVLDLEDGRQDQQAALSTLHRGLAQQTSALLAWKVLVDEGQAASVTRQWRDRSALTLALAQHGISTTLPAKHASDIEVLCERSAVNLHALHGEAVLPVAGGLYISRAVAKTLRETVGREPVLVVGDAGAGKSAVIQDLASARLGDEEVIVLRASDVAGTNRLVTNAPLQEVLRAWAGPPGLLVIDGVDALRGSEDREYLSSIVAGLAGTRWQVVASARSFDTRNSQPLQRAFAGEPVSMEGSMVDPQLSAVRHLLVADLSDDDLNQVIVAPMPVAEVLAEAAPDLRKLLRNPFNLRLAATLAGQMTAGQHAELVSVRSRVELLGHYWTWRIRNQDKTARDALLKRLASSMLTNRRLQTTEEEPTVRETDSVALESLLSQSVLSALDGPIPGVGRVLAFSHNILFDYATAIYVLYHPLDATGLVKSLDADPILPLVARPSFDLLVDLLWQARATGGFWPVAFSVAGSEHVLASLAVASRVVNLAHDPNDLLELASNGHGSSGSNEHLPRQRFTRQVIGAIRARAVVPDLTTAMLPLATLAKQLAENAEASFEDAALATDLLIALHFRAPVSAKEPDAAGIAERAAAIAMLLDAAPSDPARRERMAGLLVRQAVAVVGISSEVRAAMHRLLNSDAALAQWGGTVLTWFPEAVAPAMAHDPDLARRLAVISMTFEETRDEDVAFGGGSVLPLRESRKQQSQHAAWRLGEEFPKICADDIVTATDIICEVLGAADSADDPEMWPMFAHGVTGWLEHGYGFGVDFHSQDNEQKMLSALADALVEQEIEAAQPVVTLLVDKVHNTGVWAALMESPRQPAALCRALFPAFESGSLLTHPDTFSQAATLLKAAATEGTVPHQDLEAVVGEALKLVDQNGRSEYVKDVLVGCLDVDAITDESIAAHRASVGEKAPDIPAPPSMITQALPYSPIDHLLEGGVTVGPQVAAAARDLHTALDKLDDNEASDPDAIAQLVDMFALAHDVFAAAETTPSQIQYLLVDAARRLARAKDITPEHVRGPLVIKVLAEAAGCSDAGTFLS